MRRSGIRWLRRRHGAGEGPYARGHAPINDPSRLALGIGWLPLAARPVDKRCKADCDQSGPAWTRVVLSAQLALPGVPGQPGRDARHQEQQHLPAHQPGRAQRDGRGGEQYRAFRDAAVHPAAQ